MSGGLLVGRVLRWHRGPQGDRDCSQVHLLASPSLVMPSAFNDMEVLPW